MDIADAIAEARAGTLPIGLLIRTLLQRERWWVPCTAPGTLARLEIDGVDVQPAFTSISALNEAVSAGALPSGLEVEAMAPEALLARSEGVPTLRMDGLDLDLDLLRELAAAAPVERALAAAGSAGSLLILKDYPGFWLIYDEHGASQGIAMAPDDKDRTLVAVFTAPDSRDAFLDRFEVGLNPRVVRVSGQELFETLADLDVDGIVFDCAGPLTPRAFRIDLARRVLES